MIKCGTCGERNPDGAQVCQVCGSILSPDDVAGLDAFKTGIYSDIRTGVMLSERYILRKELGRGGMGVVWLAEDQKLDDREVAIKLLPKELSGNIRAINFLKNEAKVALELAHPNIMRLYNFEEDNGKNFLVMEFLRGPTFEEILAARGKLTVEETIAVAKQICDGLAFAHSKKVIHRDLKPANLMLSAPVADPEKTPLDNVRIEVKVTDFGIARVVKDTMSRFSNVSTTGTLVYMSPEQIRGKRTDARSDIYSLGIVLYEFLSGDPPFFTGDLVHQHLREKPDPIEEKPEWINSVLLKCLEKEPASRFENMADLREALLNQGSVRGGIQIQQHVSPQVEVIAPSIVKEAVIETGKNYTETYNNINLEMVWIPGGEFMMGSPSSEKDRDDNEGPQHQVKLNGFRMGKYEVTQDQYEKIMGTNPSHFKGSGRLPVETVSWNDAMEFCKKLSEGADKQYTLPSEAQWEYACRAGTTTRFCFGDSDSQLGEYAWYGSNSGSKTHEVGQKKPNRFGLCDIHGNVWEWCSSLYKGYPYNARDGREDLSGSGSRVLRGGSWGYYPRYCRSADRCGGIPPLTINNDGFRVIAVPR